MVNHCPSGGFLARADHRLGSIESRWSLGGRVV